MSIERSTFNDAHPDSNLIALLEIYSASYPYSTTFANSSPNFAYYKLSATWAKLLLEHSDLSKTESFICNVFAGIIKEPGKEIKAHKDEYSILYNLMSKDIAAQKKLNTAEYTVITGIWAPTNHAAVLGVHPSFGIQVGGRFNIRHQVDFTMQFRFLKSAGTYTVKRNNSLYNLDHYFGGYIGGDYTYYFISRTKTDIGLLAGIGFDGFDIANSDDNNNKDYLKPLSVSSFNFNAGLRFNYFINPSFYLGLQGRYNVVDYRNKGGSNLSGDAVSIDLILGFTSHRTARGNYY